MKGENCFILAGENKVFNSHRFAIADNNWNITKSCCEYPNITSLLIEPKEDFRQMLYNSVFYRVSPNKEKAIFATYKGTLLQFLDISKNIDSVKIIKSILLDRPMKREERDNKHAGWVYGFEDVYVTNDYIYAIYNEKTVKENPMFGNNILIYNWNGELVNSYKTDIYLRNIAVDEKRNIAYVIACEEDSNFFLAKIIFLISNV